MKAINSAVLSACWFPTLLVLAFIVKSGVDQLRRNGGFNNQSQTKLINSTSLNDLLFSLIMLPFTIFIEALSALLLALMAVAHIVFFLFVYSPIILAVAGLNAILAIPSYAAFILASPLIALGVFNYELLVAIEDGPDSYSIENVLSEEQDLLGALNVQNDCKNATEDQARIEESVSPQQCYNSLEEPSALYCGR